MRNARSLTRFSNGKAESSRYTYIVTIGMMLIYNCSMNSNRIESNRTKKMKAERFGDEQPKKSVLCMRACMTVVLIRHSTKFHCISSTFDIP